MLHHQSNDPGIQQQEFIQDDEHSIHESTVEESPFVYTGSKYPPGIASELPGFVLNYEQAWKDAGSVKIFELIEYPFFLPGEELDEDSLREELARFVTLLENKNIRIDIPAGKETLKVYRFITEFLLEQEVDDLNLDGLERVFFYNENYSS